MMRFIEDPISKSALIFSFVLYYISQLTFVKNNLILPHNEGGLSTPLSFSWTWNPSKLLTITPFWISFITGNQLIVFRWNTHGTRIFFAIWVVPDLFLSCTPKLVHNVCSTWHTSSHSKYSTPSLQSWLNWIY